MSKPSFVDRILAPFQRKTSSGRYIPEIDGLRCLAIVLVVLFHAHHFFSDGSEPLTAGELSQVGFWNFLTYLPNFFIAKGWFGVQIFFVISGMVLALPFAAHHLQDSKLPELKNYFLRRLIRIEIPYVLTLTFLLIYTSMFLRSGSIDLVSQLSELLPHYLAGLAYSYTVIYDGALNPLLYVSWTLEIEIQFYLLAPFLCKLFTIKNVWLRRGILILGVPASELLVFGLNQIHPTSMWDHTLISQIGYFFMGLLLADFILSPSFQRLKSSWWDLVGLIVWPLNFLLIEWHSWINVKPFFLCLAFASVLYGRRFKAILSNRWATATGTMCYSIYLFHSFFFYIVLRPHLFGPIIPIDDGQWPSNLIGITLMSGLAIGLSALVFLVVEKPFARGRLPRWRK